MRNRFEVLNRPIIVYISDLKKHENVLQKRFENYYQLSKITLWQNILHIFIEDLVLQKPFKKTKLSKDVQRGIRKSILKNHLIKTKSLNRIFFFFATEKNVDLRFIFLKYDYFFSIYLLN